MDSGHSPKAIDLFCGCGGMSAGFVNAGFEIVAAVDKDRKAAETYDYNHTCSPITEDIRNENIVDKILSCVNRAVYERNEIDAIIGGPPCRDFSQSNINTHTESESPSDYLIRRHIQMINDLRPSIVVIENVPKLLRNDREVYKQAISTPLKKIGYSVEAKILKAEEFGVPQRRRRVFVIGVLNGEPPFPTPTHGNQTDNLKPIITVSEAISDLPTLPTGGGGQEIMDYLESPSSQSEFVEELREPVEEDTLFNHQTTVNREQTYKRFKHIPQGGNWRDIPKHLMENYTDRERTHDNIYYRLKEDKSAKTVANFRKQMMVHPTQNRLLSVREAARLQSFPDNYCFIGDGFNARQQMVGDAVPVKLAEAVGKRLYRYWLGAESVDTGEEATAD